MKLLLLGGTGEAMALAQALAARGGIDVVTSLAGRTQISTLPPGTVRLGGFGGVPGLAQYLQEEQVDLIVDATHPYAAQISRNAAEAAAGTGRPLLRVERPPWRTQAGDNWIDVDSLKSAALVARDFRRVFLTTGATELNAFAGMPGTCYVVRAIGLPPAPLPLAAHEIILARGPFAEEEELRLLEGQRIEAIVSKNSGGSATYAKIAAARALNIPVIMIGRPIPTVTQRRVPTVTGIEDALRWVAGMRTALADR